MQNRNATLARYEARMLETAPWVGLDKWSADRLVTALVDMSGVHSYAVLPSDPEQRLGGNPGADARTVRATPVRKAVSL